MGIIIYNYKALSRIVIKFGAYIHLWFPYTCAKFQPDRSIVGVVFVLVQKELEEKKQKNKDLKEKTETLVACWD